VKQSFKNHTTYDEVMGRSINGICYESQQQFLHQPVEEFLKTNYSHKTA